MFQIRTALILLVMAAVFLSQSGPIVWSNVKQLSSHYVCEHRKIISSRDTIILPSSAFNDKHTIVWLEKDEIRYLGNMFDVKLIIKSAQQVKLIGHYDRVEDELFNLLYKLLETDKKGSSDKRSIFHFGFSDAILNNLPSFNVLYENIENSIISPFIQILYSSHNTDNDIKPPEHSCKVSGI